MRWCDSRRREFIVDEKDVTIVLTAINTSTSRGFLSNITVANCGWVEENEVGTMDAKKWFISFNANDKLYGDIVNHLNEVGVLTLETRPGSQVDVVFTRGA